MAYHISGHPSAAGRAQDRESSPARDRRSTTVPRHQLVVVVNVVNDISSLDALLSFAILL